MSEKDVQDFANGKFNNGNQPLLNDEEYEKQYTFTEIQLMGDSPEASEQEKPTLIENPDKGSAYKFIPPEVVAEKPDEGTTTPMLEQPSVEKPAGDAAGAVAGTETQSTTPSLDQTQQITTPSTHLFDWGGEGVTLESVMKDKGKDTPLYDILHDYMTWSQENGKPYNPFAINAIVNKANDITLSPEDNEKARKKAERAERWNKIEQFLLHLGNAIGNVASGGYGHIKLEEPAKWTERQRLLKEKADQQRIANNQSIWAQMQKDRAEQRAYELQKQNAAATAAYRQAMIDAANTKNTKNAELVDAKIKELEEKINASQQTTPAKVETEKAKQERYRRPAAGRGRTGGGGKTGSTKITKYERDNEGRVTKSETNTTYGTGNKPLSSKPKQGNGRKISLGVNWLKK